MFGKCFYVSLFMLMKNFFLYERVKGNCIGRRPKIEDDWSEIEKKRIRKLLREILIKHYSEAVSVECIKCECS